MARRVIAAIEDHIRMDSPDKRRRERWKLKTIYAEFSQWSRTVTLDDLSDPTCEYNFTYENRLMIPLVNARTSFFRFEGADGECKARLMIVEWCDSNVH